MNNCVFIAKCPFFNDKMSNMPGTAAMFKKKYCQGEPCDCARYQARETMGPGKVPVDLFPNQHARIAGL